MYTCVVFNNTGCGNDTNTTEDQIVQNGNEVTLSYREDSFPSPTMSGKC